MREYKPENRSRGLEILGENPFAVLHITPSGKWVGRLSFAINQFSSHQNRLPKFARRGLLEDHSVLSFVKPEGGQWDSSLGTQWDPADVGRCRLGFPGPKVMLYAEP